MKRSFFSIRTLSALVGLSVILACGGGSDSVAGNHYPLTTAITVDCVNNDNQNVHILIGGEAFNAANNQVVANGTRTRSSPLSYTWNSDADVVTITIFAGRNGVVSSQGSVNMTGAQRMNNKHIRAVFNANQTVTVTIP